MRIFIICFLFIAGINSLQAQEKCLVNVLNTICLGGNASIFEKNYPSLPSDNKFQDKRFNADPRDLQSNESARKIFKSLRYTNIENVSVKSYKAKIYSVIIYFDEASQDVNIDKLTFPVLHAKLSGIYGEPTVSENLFMWCKKEFCASVFKFDNSFTLQYLIGSVSRQIDKESGF
jgi:hypothetical protein